MPVEWRNLRTMSDAQLDAEIDILGKGRGEQVRLLWDAQEMALSQRRSTRIWKAQCAIEHAERTVGTYVAERYRREEEVAHLKVYGEEWEDLAMRWQVR